MSRQGVSGITFADNPLIAVGMGKSLKNSTAAPLAARDLDAVDTRQVLANHTSALVLPSNAGQEISFTSDSVDDAEVVIIVLGLGVDFIAQQELVTLTGTTPVVSAFEWTRINVIILNGVKVNVGVVKAYNNADVYATIEPGVGRSRTGVYSGPANQAIAVMSAIATMTRAGSNADASSVIYVSYSNIHKVNGSWVNFAPVEGFAFSLQRRGTSVASLDLPIPVVSDGPVDLLFEGEGNAAGISLSIRTTVLLETK